MMCYVLPPKTTCQGDRSTFNPGWGGCSTYAEGGDNDGYCSSEKDNGILAMDACSECGKCEDISNAVDSETASLHSVNQALKKSTQGSTQLNFYFPKVDLQKMQKKIRRS